MTDKVSPDGYVDRYFRVKMIDGQTMKIRASFWEVQYGALVFAICGPGVPTTQVYAVGASQWVCVDQPEQS